MEGAWELAISDDIGQQFKRIDKGSISSCFCVQREGRDETAPAEKPTSLRWPEQYWAMVSDQ
jgi:hypothetical protein